VNIDDGDVSDLGEHVMTSPSSLPSSSSSLGSPTLSSQSLSPSLGGTGADYGFGSSGFSGISGTSGSSAPSAGPPKKSGLQLRRGE
jgi:hypothetical protein